jgi:phenylacetate-coenzyme A ligase PaaK-like adenylate-forming protein
MFKVKGVNVWPSHVEDVLFGIDSIRDYRVRIALDPKGREVMRMELLTYPERSSEQLVKTLSERLRSETGLGFDVSASDDSTQWLHETTGEAAKPRRWLDERMK